MTSHAPDTIERRAYRVNEFCEAYGIGRTKFYEHVNAGRLRVRKNGRSTRVLVRDAERWADELPTEEKRE